MHYDPIWNAFNTFEAGLHRARTLILVTHSQQAALHGEFLYDTEIVRYLIDAWPIMPREYR